MSRRILRSYNSSARCSIACRHLAASAAIWGGLSARTPPVAFAPSGVMPDRPARRLRALPGDRRRYHRYRQCADPPRGIAAPEGGQTCARAGGGTWPCGQAATRELQQLVGRLSVRCDSHGNDKYGRMLGICYAGAIDINAEMVRRGFAWAFVKYSTTYVAEEAGQRAAPDRQAPTLPPGPPGRQVDVAQRVAPPDAPPATALSRATSRTAAASITCHGAPGTPR